MTRLVWGAAGERRYEAGVDRGVLYVDDEPGVPWNGLTSISEEPSGGEVRSYYIDGINYLNVSAAEQFSATIEAFTYPDEFELCDGSTIIYKGLYATQQPRKQFSLSYRTKIGNDLDGPDHGYKIHLIYNALAEPSQKPYNTLDDSSNLSTFSWKIVGRPPAISGYKHTPHFIIDSRTTNSVALEAIENALYGTDSESAQMLTPSELFNIFELYSDFLVIDNGDGTFTVTGSDDYIQMIDPTTFQITWPSAVYIDEDTYTISTPLP